MLLTILCRYLFLKFLSGIYSYLLNKVSYICSLDHVIGIYEGLGLFLATYCSFQMTFLCLDTLIEKINWACMPYLWNFSVFFPHSLLLQEVESPKSSAILTESRFHMSCVWRPLLWKSLGSFVQWLEDSSSGKYVYGTLFRFSNC